jgi:ribonuclease BN (tRNA processing enzyme)
LAPGFQDGGWGHASPEDAARVAEKAGVKKLFLTHFMPDFYPTIASRKKAENAAQKIFKNSTAAKDGMSVII